MTNTKASFDKRIGKIVDGLQSRISELETKFEKITKVLHNKDRALAIALPTPPPPHHHTHPRQNHKNALRITIRRQIIDFWDYSRCTFLFFSPK